MKRGVIIVMCAALFAGFGSSVGAEEGDFEARIEYGGQSFKQVIRQKELIKGPKWSIEGGQECPLPVSKAVKAARTALEKVIPDAKKWGVYAVNLGSSEKDRTHWYYSVSFESPDGENDVMVNVFLDGSVPAIEKK